MQNLRIIENYAKVLFELAKEHHIIPTMLKDLKSIATSYKLSAEMKTLSSPTMTLAKKERLILKITNNKTSTLVQNFLKIIVKNGRERLISDIAKKFTDLIDLESGVTCIKVISAQELNKDHKIYLEDLFKKQVTDNFRTTYSVDSNIVGGLVIEYGPYRIDASVSGILNKIRALSDSAPLNFDQDRSI